MALSWIGLSALACIALYFSAILHRRRQKLKHISGPSLAAFTDLWRARIQFFGPFVPSLQKLHQQYGPIVRIGPNTVSISDPSHIAIVANPRAGFAKVQTPSC
jgi:uncharacterized membrane protein YecN with MAPEG domain